MICNDEAIAWSAVAQGWRQLWGDFDRLGVALQWHDFRTERPLDWGRSFRPRSLEFCLNVGGRGAVGDRADYIPGSAGYYAVADEPLRASRQARDRVERTKELLARDLANPPTLETLGREVGCSPFYLSRSFSREVGLTIPQYLRKLRMERAAELLRSGRYNVTETATEVGYASLSHFSKAFCETIGCCPVLYPMAKNVVID